MFEAGADEPADAFEEDVGAEPEVDPAEDDGADEDPEA